MTDEIPQAAYEFVDELANAIPRNPLETSYRTLAARLAHENGLVPQERPLAAALTALDTVTGAMTREAYAEWIEFELAKHNHAVVKVKSPITDEERLIEARELCAKVAEGLRQHIFANGYRKGRYDKDPEMIAMLAALKARDGVA